MSATTHRHSKRRSGIAAVEAAMLLPVMTLITFGSIQIAHQITLRHKCVSVVELGSLKYLLKKITEDELVETVERIASETGLVAPKARIKVQDNNLLELRLAISISKNSNAPIIVSTSDRISTTVLLYRP